jgi:MFS family permease
MKLEQAAVAADASSWSRTYAVYVLALLLAANTLSYADRHLFSVLIPAIKADFGIGDAALGFIGGPAFIISYVLFTLPLARLADRWSRRGVIAVSATLWSVATAACGVAGNVWQLATARVTVGVGEAGGLPPSQAIISGLFGPERRSSALGVLASSTYLGLVLGLTGGATIASLWGWRAAFIALAAPGIPVALLLWFTGPGQLRDAAPPARAGGDTMWATTRRCWSIPSFRLLALGVGAFNIFGYAGAIWMPAYFMRSHGMSMIEAGAWLGMGAAAGGIAGSLASGALVDALRPRDERWQLRVPALGFICSFPLFIVMLLLPSGAAVAIGRAGIPLVALLSVFTGFLASLWAGPSFGAAARLVRPQERAQATALLVVIINIMGSAVGPLIAGLVSEALTARFAEEALRYSLLALSGLTVVGGLLFWRASDHYPADLPRD